MANLIPPEGFVYDDRTGYYYTQEIIEDETGNLVQHVKWFDPESGDLTDKYYDIPDNNDYAFTESNEPESELDDEFQIQDQDMNDESIERRQDFAGRKTLIIIASVIGAAVLAVIIFAIAFVLRKNAGSNKNVEEGNNITGTEPSNGVEVGSHDYILTTEESPLDSYISEYCVMLQAPSENGFDGMRVTGAGDMTGEFLVNPSDYKTGEVLYNWDFFLSDKVGIRVYGLADCEDLSEPKYILGSEYLRAAVIYKDGDNISVHEEIPFHGESDGFNVSGFNVKKYDASIYTYDITEVGIVIKMGNYAQNGDITATILDENGVPITVGINYSYEDNSVMTDGMVEEMIYEAEQGIEPGVDLHSSGMSGFKHVGAFDCTDKSLPADYLPRIILEDDGYCELYANLGDGFYKFQGYYEYKSTGSEYDDQGGETYIYMHFPGNSDNLSYAEIIYDGEIDDGYIYFLTDGFGLMGGDANFAGYFTRAY